jgi:protein-tyrosine-phosphatase
MHDRVYNVLFLCTGNTACSVLAEGILRKDGAERFQAYSAGSEPKGVVNPFGLKVLDSYAYPSTGFRSKNWDEFAAPGAPEMDFVFTVCDSAAGEACPLWPGRPMTAHWGIEDPAAVEGSAAVAVRITARTGASQWLAEFIATFGLLVTILAVARFRIEAIAMAVGLYITSAYWFTASTSFANPAVTIERGLTATFAGIAPADVPGFVAAQLAGALAGMAVIGWLLRPAPVREPA